MWNYKYTSVISTSRRNLNTLNRGKISPAGRNDKLLIKLSILSVVALVENSATHGGMCFSRSHRPRWEFIPSCVIGLGMHSHRGAWERDKDALPIYRQHILYQFTLLPALSPMLEPVLALHPGQMGYFHPPEPYQAALHLSRRLLSQLN